MTEKIYLLREPDVRRLVGRLRQFFNNDEEKTLAAIIQTLEDNPYATFAEVFRKVSEHRGKGKAHSILYYLPAQEGTTSTGRSVPGRLVPGRRRHW